MNDITDTIWKHLGNAAFVEATDAYAITWRELTFSFLVPGAKHGYRSVAISLRASGTYEMHFSGGAGTSLTKHDIPGDKLQETFTKATGVPTKKKER